MKKIRSEKDREKAFGNIVRIDRLAKYNAEVSRGIIHTDEWKQFMEKEQEWFNIRQEHIECGLKID